MTLTIDALFRRCTADDVVGCFPCESRNRCHFLSCRLSCVALPIRFLLLRIGSADGIPLSLRFVAAFCFGTAWSSVRDIFFPTEAYMFHCQTVRLIAGVAMLTILGHATVAYAQFNPAPAARFLKTGARARIENTR